MGLEERERQGGGGLAARIPPAPPGPGACEVPHVAHRASHIAACMCVCVRVSGSVCVRVCVCVSVRVRACSGARGVRSSPSPLMPFVGRRAAAPRVAPPNPRRPSAPPSAPPASGGCSAAPLPARRAVRAPPRRRPGRAAGRCCRGAGKKMEGGGGMGGWGSGGGGGRAVPAESKVSPGNERGERREGGEGTGHPRRRGRTCRRSPLQPRTPPPRQSLPVNF